MPREGSSLRQKYTPESEGQSLTSAREQGAGVQGRKGVHVVAFQVKSRERGGILKISARDMSEKERKPMVANKKSSISQASSMEGMGEFWDTHDFTEYDTNSPDVDFAIACAVPIELELFTSLEKQAQLRGVKIETLVNLWLQQKLVEQN